MSYLAVLEHGPTSWGAYVPDLPGCYAAAATREEVERLIREAVVFHVSGLLAEGEPVPPPGSATDLVAAGSDGPYYGSVFEEEDGAWSAWVPDVPECRVRASSREQARQAIAAALMQRLDEWRAARRPLPTPGTSVLLVETAGDPEVRASTGSTL
jgi:predicted RNase H-like HicB family nuclease